MSPLRWPGAGRVEEFAATLEGRLPVSGDARVAELVMITQRLAALPAPRFEPAASARIRQRLVAVAAVSAAAAEEAPTRALAASWRVRRLTSVAVGSLAGVTALAGVAVGAAHSLPGDPFYGLKRTAEAVQLDLAGSPAAKGARELQFAATRLAELRQLGVADPHAASLLHDMTTETAAAQRDLISAARSSHSPTPLSEFESAVDRQITALSALAAQAPTSLQPQLAGTVHRLSDLVRDADRIAGSLGAPPTAPGKTGKPGRSPAPGHRHHGSPIPPPTGATTSPTSKGTAPAGSRSATTAPSTSPSPSNPLPSLPLPTKLPSLGHLLSSLLPSL